MPRTYIDCPRARTDMTPCIARDAHLALADDGECVGCGIRPRAAITELWPRLEGELDAKAGNALASAADDPAMADELAEIVKAYVEDKPVRRKPYPEGEGDDG